MPARPRLGERLHAWIMARVDRPYERQTAHLKRPLLGTLTGTVVEIGPGTGPNLKFFAPGIHWIGIEPNPAMHGYLEKEAARLGRDVELRHGTAERIPLPDGSADAVVSTLVLCTVPDPAAVVAEALRVLKPGSRFVFLEHVGAPAGTAQLRFQKFIKPIWRFCAEGCEPDRDTACVLAAAGFADLQLERLRLPFPIVGPHVMGVGVKGGEPFAARQALTV
jgi:SAM-dependent methyltransferase